MCFADRRGVLATIENEIFLRRLRQQMKPKLSRSVVTTAKINLNKYWAKFEKLSSNKLPLMELFLENNPIEDNEINDNIANEKIDS